MHLRLAPHEAADEDSLRRVIAKREGIDARTITCLRTLRRSLDARQRAVMVDLVIRLYVGEEPQGEEYERVSYGDVSKGRPVIVVGAGPAGLFAALRLVELGLRPLVVERGRDVHTRKRDLALIRPRQAVDPESNYAFGEGGAGTFSDGKLYTRSHKRGDGQKVLRVLCQHGADTAILSDARPHVGTDKLPAVVERMRLTIEACGGRVLFGHRMEAITIEHGKAVGVVCHRCPQGDEAEGQVELRGEAVVLATGHSARDTYLMLAGMGLRVEAKGLAVGLRLEHPSALIDQLQYHSREGRGRYLPAAEYSFTRQVEGRGVYSFCMCPGGVVVPAATGREQVVVNGMSPSGRQGRWSNSGMVVELRTEDVAGDDPLRMMRYQEELERECWRQGGCQQTAPAQRMEDFTRGRMSYDLPVSSYAPGLVTSPLREWLPEGVASRLAEGLRQMGSLRKGFLTNEATLIGVETRTSSPLRLLRDPSTLQHVDLPGLFPAGEGAGYAGGIVSSAIDGERAAEAVASYLSA